MNALALESEAVDNSRQLEEAHSHIASLLEKLDAGSLGDEHNEVGNMMVTMEGMLGQFSENQYELQHEINDILESSRHGLLTHDKLSEMITMEQTRTHYLANIVGSLRFQIEKLYRVLSDTASNPDLDPAEALEKAASDISMMMHSVDSLSKVIVSPTKKLTSTIKQIDSELIIHLNRAAKLNVYETYGKKPRTAPKKDELKQAQHVSKIQASFEQRHGVKHEHHHHHHESHSKHSSHKHDNSKQTTPPVSEANTPRSIDGDHERPPSASKATTPPHAKKDGHGAEDAHGKEQHHERDKRKDKSEKQNSYATLFGNKKPSEGRKGKKDASADRMALNLQSTNSSAAIATDPDLQAGSTLKSSRASARDPHAPAEVALDHSDHSGGAKSGNHAAPGSVGAVGGLHAADPAVATGRSSLGGNSEMVMDDEVSINTMEGSVHGAHGKKKHHGGKKHGKHPPTGKKHEEAHVAAASSVTSQVTGGTGTAGSHAQEYDQLSVELHQRSADLLMREMKLTEKEKELERRRADMDKEITKRVVEMFNAKKAAEANATKNAVLEQEIAKGALKPQMHVNPNTGTVINTLSTHPDVVVLSPQRQGENDFSAGVQRGTRDNVTKRSFNRADQTSRPTSAGAALVRGASNYNESMMSEAYTGSVNKLPSESINLSSSLDQLPAETATAAAAKRKPKDKEERRKTELLLKRERLLAKSRSNAAFSSTNKIDPLQFEDESPTNTADGAGRRFSRTDTSGGGLHRGIKSSGNMDKLMLHIKAPHVAGSAERMTSTDDLEQFIATGQVNIMNFATSEPPAGGGGGDGDSTSNNPLRKSVSLPDTVLVNPDDPRERKQYVRSQIEGRARKEKSDLRKSFDIANLLVKSNFDIQATAAAAMAVGMVKDNNSSYTSPAEVATTAGLQTALGKELEIYDNQQNILITRTYKEKPPPKTFRDLLEQSECPLLTIYREYADCLSASHRTRLLVAATNENKISNEFPQSSTLQQIIHALLGSIEGVNADCDRMLALLDGCEKVASELISIVKAAPESMQIVSISAQLHDLFRDFGLVESLKIAVDVQLFEFRSLFERINAQSQHELAVLCKESREFDQLYRNFVCVQGKALETHQRLGACKERCGRYQLVAFERHLFQTQMQQALRGAGMDHGPAPSAVPVQGQNYFNLEYFHEQAVHQLQQQIEDLKSDLEIADEEIRDLEAELQEVMQSKEKTPAVLLFFTMMHDPAFLKTLQQLLLQLTHLRPFAESTAHVDYVTLKKRIQVCVICIPTLDLLIDKYQILYKKWSHHRLNWFAERKLLGGAADALQSCPLCYHDLSADDAGGTAKSPSKGKNHAKLMVTNDRAHHGAQQQSHPQQQAQHFHQQDGQDVLELNAKQQKQTLRRKNETMLVLPKLG